ncbi:MAG: hypothetical protein HC802_11430 [Caldilineaceae bacterium]|nr:hypothetical protein [Caldilineaceae bacterium]
MDTKTVQWIKFVHTNLESTAQSHHSAISGHVVGGLGQGRAPQVALLDDQAQRREVTVDAAGAFAFEELGPGLYSVGVVGREEVASRSDIALDGANCVALELVLPTLSESDNIEDSQGISCVTGIAPASAGRMARLLDVAGNEQAQIVGMDDGFRFEALPAGAYTLEVEGGYQLENLAVDGRNGWEVIFSPMLTTWKAKVSLAGEMPGYSVVRVEVEGQRDLPVHIWKDDWKGMSRRTGSKPEYGDFALEFSPLEPGVYMVEPEGLGVWTDVELTGLEVVWIDFRKQAVASASHMVRPLLENGAQAYTVSSSPAI